MSHFDPEVDITGVTTGAEVRARELETAEKDGQVIHFDDGSDDDERGGEPPPPDPAVTDPAVTQLAVVLTNINRLKGERDRIDGELKTAKTLRDTLLYANRAPQGGGGGGNGGTQGSRNAASEARRIANTANMFQDFEI